MKKYKKPNFFVYGLFKLISKFLSKFVFNLKVVRNETKGVKDSYVIIANHESAIDFIALAAASKRRVNFVISNSFYQSLPINPLLTACGVIPKQQFQTTISDMRKMKQVVDNERVLAIYPAGMMTEDGVSTPIPLSTGKFAKWMDKDVYIAKIKGSYLTSPKWSGVRRKGKMELDIYKLFSKEDLAQLDSEKIFQILNEHLNYNAYSDQEERKIEYTNGNNIRGLENVLYKCPKCKKEFVMKATSDDKITCSVCGYEVESDKYGFLSSNHESINYRYPSDWSNYIYNSLKEEIDNNPNYELKSNAKISMIDYKKHKFVYVGDAQVTLNLKEFVLDGNIKGERFNETYSVNTFPILPFSPGKYFEFQNGNDIYRICLENGVEVMKWINTIKIIYQKNR